MAKPLNIMPLGLKVRAQHLKPSMAHGLVQASWPFIAAIVFALLMHMFVAPSVGGFATNVLMGIGINIILAVSLNIVNGFTGQFSIGHAGFMAVGGYVTAMIVYYGSIKLWGTADFAGGALSYTGIGVESRPWLAKGDLLFIGACLAGGVVAAIAGFIVGLPSLRLRGDYLAIVTLGFGEIVRVVLQGTKDQIPPWQAERAADVPMHELSLMLGGPKGFNLLPTYTTMFWVYLFVALTLVFVYRLKVSSTGRAFLSIREDEIAAQAMGVSITRYKVRAFVISSFLAGIAGGLYAMFIGAINASDLGFQRSFELVIMVVLGGLGSISGTALAAIILTILPELLRNPPMLWPAGVLVLVIVGAAQIMRKEFKWKPIFWIVLVTALLESARQYSVWRGVNIADYRLILYALLLIIMMIMRPQGLFGVKEIWDYFGEFQRWRRGKSSQKAGRA